MKDMRYGKSVKLKLSIPIKYRNRTYHLPPVTFHTIPTIPINPSHLNIHLYLGYMNEFKNLSMAHLGR